MKGPALYVRGIRGAIDVLENTEENILAATKELLQEIVEKNTLNVEDIVSVIFTTTPDLNAAFPAKAAREMGWNHVPLLCASEINVPGALPRCIRLLILVNTTKTQQEICHIYLRNAIRLRENLDQV